MYVGHRLLRTKFLLLFCSGVVWLAHGKCEVMALYHVQTAYEGFKVQYEESWRSADTTTCFFQAQE